MLKPKLQYCGQYWKSWWEELTHLKRPWCWERLKVGGGGDDRGRDGWMASLTQWTYVWVNSRSWETWCARVHGVAKSQTWQSDWTKLNHVSKPRLAFWIITHLTSFSFWLADSKLDSRLVSGSICPHLALTELAAVHRHISHPSSENTGLVWSALQNHQVELAPEFKSWFHPLISLQSWEST